MPRLPLPSVLRRKGRRALLLPAAAASLFQLGGPARPVLLLPSSPAPVRAAAPDTGDVTQGALRITRGGQVVECPLRHTDVQAEVSGFVARVRVTQTFVNPYDEPIEAVYVFPLSNTGAVDEMTMVVGSRRLAGVVKRRSEARDVYEQALAQGYTASLLEQERPNIFTQSVGNIPPGQTVKVEIAYVDLLPYDGGRYEFHFPMVVGPRYIPGRPTGAQGDGWAPDTDRVPDASRITPPVLKPGQRNGHDVSLSVKVEAGVPIRALDVHEHEAGVQRFSASAVSVTLSPRDSVPNKDFVLSYQVAGDKPETALLTHAGPGQDGYFLLMMQPRDVEEALRESPPRDVCFLVDVSGSMSGQPLAKVTEAMERFFERMRPQDRLQVVTFAGEATPLFPAYRPADRTAIAEALRLTRAMTGGGGTEMLRGIKAVMAEPVEGRRMRIVVMLTDGYIGNEDEIIGEVGRRAGDQMRFWTVGIGSSPNRHLIDGVARQGGGMSSVLGLDDDPTELVGRIMDRVQRAQLSQVRIDWGGMDVSETYPARVGELWAGRPVFVLGRYRGAGEATVTLSGLAEGEPVRFEVPVRLAAAGEGAEAMPHAALAAAWARKKIEHLQDQMAVAGTSTDLVEEITVLALEHRLMSPYTSFVAVDESAPAVDPATPPRRMLVPVPLPLGVSYEGVFGPDAEAMYEADDFAGVKKEDNRDRKAMRMGGSLRRAPAAGVPGGVEGGVPGGVVGGMVGGVAGVAALATPAPPPPAPHPAGSGQGAAAMPVTLHAPPREMYAQMEEVTVAGSGVRRLHPERAQAALDEARRRQQRGDADAAAAGFALAATLADGPGSPHRAAALSGLATAARDREERAERARPSLKRPLALILRNTDLGSALAAVAAAAEVPLDVAAGSLDDVGEAFGPSALRIAFLDLRGASAARALTWLTQPAGLRWSLRENRLEVRSARRGAGGAWVYALPGVDEATLRRALVAADPAARVTLLAPSVVLVEATASGHARAAAVAPPAATRTVAAQRAAVESRRAQGSLAAWTWPLLAAALQDGVDDEAASELLEAWRVPGVTGPEPTLALRALWAAHVARAVRPADPTLARLWDTAAAAVQKALLERGAAALQGEGALYAALLHQAEPSLTLAHTEGAAAPLPARLRRLLLEDARDTRDAEAVLAALQAGEIRGDDGFVLAALGLRHAGGAAWQRFRPDAAELARAAGAGGGALRLADRLDGARAVASRR